ncbi:MAG TPA: desulfoferrodoxin family protein [Bacilli bacterium]|nr:desulfoferrodoxin family protein [Bacilli bacterium]
MSKFFICRHCGNIIGMIYASGVPVVCCGEEMELLVAQTADATLEKHVPVVEIKGNVVEVTVGSVPHPMVAAHYIQWIYLETKHGGQRKALNPGDAPHVKFTVIDDEPIAVYEYCNIHGLWKTVIKK